MRKSIYFFVIILSFTLIIPGESQSSKIIKIVNSSSSLARSGVMTGVNNTGKILDLSAKVDSSINSLTRVILPNINGLRKNFIKNKSINVPAPINTEKYTIAEGDQLKIIVLARYRVKNLKIRAKIIAYIAKINGISDYNVIPKDIEINLPHITKVEKGIGSKFKTYDLEEFERINMLDLVKEEDDKLIIRKYIPISS